MSRATIEEVKLVDGPTGGARPKPINHELIKKLKMVLAWAEAGEVSDLLMVYFRNGQPAFCNDYTWAKKEQMLGLLAIQEHALLRTYDVELDLK